MRAACYCCMNDQMVSVNKKLVLYANGPRTLRTVSRFETNDEKSLRQGTEPIRKYTVVRHFKC